MLTFKILPHEKNRKIIGGKSAATAVKYKQAQFWSGLPNGSPIESSDFFLVPILLFSSFHLHVSEKKLFTHFRSHKANRCSQWLSVAAAWFDAR